MNHSIGILCDAENRPHFVASFHRHAPNLEWDWVASRTARVNRSWKEGDPVPADGPPVVFESGQGHLTARLFCHKCPRSRDVPVRLERLDAVLNDFAAEGREQVTLSDVAKALRERHA